jgi:hypothetical protein
VSQITSDATPPTTPETSPGDDAHSSSDALTAKAKADMAQERAKALELDARIGKLEAEVHPPRPQPDSPGQMIGD